MTKKFIKTKTYSNDLDNKALTKALKTYKKCQMLALGPQPLNKSADSSPADCKLFIVTLGSIPKSNINDLKTFQKSSSNAFVFYKSHYFNKRFIGHMACSYPKASLKSIFKHFIMGTSIRLEEYRMHPSHITEIVSSKARLSIQIAQLMNAFNLWSAVESEQPHTKQIIDNYNVLGCLFATTNSLVFISPEELKQSGLVVKQMKTHPGAKTRQLTTKNTAKALASRFHLKKTTKLITHLQHTKTASIV